MKKFFFILLLSVNCFALSNLDSLVKRSKVLELRPLHGFILHRMPLIPVTRPDTTIKLKPLRAPLKMMNKSIAVPVSAPAPVISSSLADTVRAMQIILESMINKSESRSNDSDFMLKLIEILTGGIVSIGIAYVTTTIRGKQKNG